jgi:putative hydrolase of the HAD superfamily
MSLDPPRAFSVALLDVNSTFMFGEDRFGPDQDYGTTYSALGGQELTGEEIRAVIDSLITYLKPVYLDPDRCDSFPQVREVLAELPLSGALPEAERLLLEQVIATHEVGQIPEAYAGALRTLARSHRLGVVSNIWSVKDQWIREMRRAGVYHLFEAAVFSSDGPSMKPSQRLFERATTAMGVRPRETVFIGDSLRCDVAGASTLGIATIWIDRHGHGVPEEGPRPDWVVRDLLDLVSVDAWWPPATA